MMTLSETLRLERIEENLFRAQSADDPVPRIFGGQVIAQALLAAYATVEGRLCHSLHSYFLQPGDPRRPILFEVDRARDGASFTTRRVIAVQEGRQIFNLSASFMVAEDGFEHAASMPAAPPPESLRDDEAVLAERAAAAGNERAAAQVAAHQQQHRRVLQLRSVPPRDPGMAPMRQDPRQQLWLRAVEPIGADLQMQQAVLAYASDMALLSTAMMPHAVTWSTPGFQNASLDHAIWFHRPSDLNGWHLHHMESPSASGGRGLNRGEIYSADGHLVASVVQEGLIRMRKRG